MEKISGTYEELAMPYLRSGTAIRETPGNIRGKRR